VVSAGMMASFTRGFRKVTKAPVLAVLADGGIVLLFGLRRCVYVLGVWSAGAGGSGVCFLGRARGSFQAKDRMDG
jgi:hypothetical protein